MRTNILLLPLLISGLTLFGGCVVEPLDDLDATEALDLDDELEEQSAIEFSDELMVDANAQEFGGHGCPISHPDYPACDKEPTPIVDSDDLCAGIEPCYCFCRYNHQCWNDPSECSPLASCLTQCDYDWPGCPYPAQPAQPTHPNQCA